MSKKRTSKHHVLPRSRGGGYKDNIVIIPRVDHDAYHKLFGNMTPEEIILYLIKKYWNGYVPFMNGEDHYPKEGECVNFFLT
jgi:hypothetical protein